jgi:hypothetical protein
MRRAVWFLPVWGVLTLWATLQHQPDPQTEFGAWSRFVSTGEFLAIHVVGSIGGQALHLLGAAALAGLLVLVGIRTRGALAGFALTVLGSAGLIAGFGVAALAQPAIGSLQLDGVAVAKGVYDDVYGPLALAILIGGAVVFALGTVVLARAAAGLPGAPRWATIAYGASGPLIAVVGVAVGTAQTIGSIAAVVGGVGLALTSRNGAGDVDARI